MDDLPEIGQIDFRHSVDPETREEIQRRVSTFEEKMARLMSEFSEGPSVGAYYHINSMLEDIDYFISMSEYFNHPSAVDLFKQFKESISNLNAMCRKHVVN